MFKERQFPVTDEVRVLRYMRIEKGLSLKKAGRLLNITDGAISHIETGKMRLPVTRIEQMVQAYGYTMSDFLTLSRSRKLPNHVRTECERLLATISSSDLARALEFLKVLKKEVSR